MVLCVNYVHGYLDGIKWRYRSCSRLSLFNLCKLWLLIVHTRSSRFRDNMNPLSHWITIFIFYVTHVTVTFLFLLSDEFQRVLWICWSFIPTSVFHADISLCKSANDTWSVDPHILIIVCQIYAATHTYISGRNSLVSTYGVNGRIYKACCVAGVANCLCGHESVVLVFISQK